MATGTFGSTTSYTATLGFIVQNEANMKLGMQNLYGSLDTSKEPYTAYEISIGLKPGQFVSMGQLSGLGVNITATTEPFEAVNSRSSTIYQVTDEEFTMEASLTEFNPDVLEVMIVNGVSRTLGTAKKEILVSVGGSCDIQSRPITIESTNISCNAVASPDGTLGVSGVIITGYDMICTSGLNWGAMEAKTINTLDSTWEARPVTQRALGNQLGSIYIF